MIKQTMLRSKNYLSSGYSYNCPLGSGGIKLASDVKSFGLGYRFFTTSSTLLSITLKT